MPDDSANEKECENTAGNSSSDHDNGSNEIASDGDPSHSQDNEAADGPEADGSDPFADVLDENAAFDDFIDDLRDEIGRASCRERVCQYVYILVVAGYFKKKKQSSK